MASEAEIRQQVEAEICEWLRARDRAHGALMDRLDHIANAIERGEYHYPTIDRSLRLGEV